VANETVSKETEAGSQETGVTGVATKPRVPGFSDLRDEMDRLWETVMTAPWRPFQGFRQLQLMPAMDVFEKEGQLHVRAELPGLTEKDVQIHVERDALTITGEKKDEREVKEENFYRSERSYGKFSRQVALPAGADAGKASAKFKDGVLEVVIPLKAVEEKKTIPIQASS